MVLEGLFSSLFFWWGRGEEELVLVEVGGRKGVVVIGMDSFESLPDVGKRWLEFRDDFQFGIDPQWLRNGLIFDVRVTAAVQDWFTRMDKEVVHGSMFNLYALLYPICAMEKFVMGRTQDAVPGLVGAMGKGHHVVEERFCASWNPLEPVFLFSILLSNDNVLLLRKSVEGMLNGSRTEFWSFQLSNPYEKMCMLSYNTTVECAFCNLKGEKCECSGRMMNREPPWATKQSNNHTLQTKTKACVGWESLSHILQQSTPCYFRLDLGPREMKVLSQTGEMNKVYTLNMGFNVSADPVALHQLECIHVKKFLPRLSKNVSSKPLGLPAEQKNASRGRGKDPRRKLKVRCGTNHGNDKEKNLSMVACDGTKHTIASRNLEAQSLSPLLLWVFAFSLSCTPRPTFFLWTSLSLPDLGCRREATMRALLPTVRSEI